MPGKSFTPVSVRRRSAAQGCADAHTASAAHAMGGPVESAAFRPGFRRDLKVLRLFLAKLNSVKWVGYSFVNLLVVM